MTHYFLEGTTVELMSHPLDNRDVGSCDFFILDGEEQNCADSDFQPLQMPSQLTKSTSIQRMIPSGAVLPRLVSEDGLFCAMPGRILQKYATVGRKMSSIGDQCVSTFLVTLI